MSERVLFDARVRAWLVQEADELACYLGISFRDAPQITVRAAAHAETAQVVGADRDFRKVDPEVIARYALRFGKTGAARAAVAKIPRKEVLKFWADQGKNGRTRWRERWEDSGKGLLEKLGDIADDVTSSPITKVLFPVAALANTQNPIRDGVLKQLPFGGEILKGEQIRSDLLAGKSLKNVINAGSAGAAKSLLDTVAKVRSTNAAAAVLNMPAVVSRLAAHGVSPASIAKTSNALQAAARHVEAAANGAQGLHLLSRVNATQAAQLARKANPKLSDAQVKSALDRLVYLKVNK